MAPKPIAAAAAALLGLMLAMTGCTPPQPADLVGVVHYKDRTGGDHLIIWRGSVRERIPVTAADYTACRIGDIWPDCRP